MLPFLQLLCKCSTWNFFIDHAFFHRSDLWPSAGQRLFLLPPARPKKSARPVWQGGGFLSNSCKVPSNVPRGTFSFFGIAFGSQLTNGFFFSSGSAQETSPACLAGRGPVGQFPAKHHPMFHVELVLRSCLWPSAGRRLFSLPPARPRNQPGPSGREVTFCPITPPNPSKCSTWNIFSPFKMPKSRVLCALLVSIPLQVCYNNRRSPFSG